MKILVAPDSFKGSLTAEEICMAAERGIRAVMPEAEVISIPMADGGEGTMDSLLTAVGGEEIRCTVMGPLGEPVAAKYALLKNGIAVIEMAQSSGLYLIEAKDRNPLKTTSYGMGQLIRDGLDRGSRDFLLCIGGSATNDGGIGALQALGFEFREKGGAEVGFGGGSLLEIAEIRVDRADTRLRESRFKVACDVNNPLCGPAGASFVFGPQKGASPEMAAQLDRGLRHFADTIEAQLGRAVAELPGAGAAGGIGAGLTAFLHAELQSGVELVMEACDFKSRLKGADLVITGEGRCDDQTAGGKTPCGVIAAAKEQKVPSVVIAGAVGPGAEALYDFGAIGIFSICSGPMSLEYAMKNASILVEDAVKRILKLITHFS